MTSTNVRDDQLPGGAGTADEVPATPSATVLVLRDAPLEVLMMRRPAKSSFAPNAWVFPGGVAEAIDGELAAELADGSTLATMRLCAARELFEETGLWLGAVLEDADEKRRLLLDGHTTFRQLLEESPIDLEQFVWTSRWITPVGVPRRFDTYFFLATTSREAVASAEENEAVEVLWLRPADALQRHVAGELQLIFPTLKNLESISGFATSHELLESRRGAEIPTTRPVLTITDGQKRIVLP